VHAFLLLENLSLDINSKSRIKPLNLMPMCVRTGCVVEHLDPTQDRTEFWQNRKYTYSSRPWCSYPN